MLSSPLAMLLMSASPALAGDCDADALVQTIQAGSAHAVAASFVELAACDPDTASEIIPTTFERVLYGEATKAAAFAAIELGGAEVVRPWISTLYPDERGRTLDAMGRQCQHSPPVADFLLDSPAALGDHFWDKRWHRALIPCEDPRVKVLLTQTLQDRAVQNHLTRFDSVLDVFIEHAGPDAVPWLAALVPSVRETHQPALVRGFATAVRSDGEPTPEVAADAAKALESLAPELGTAAVPTARGVLELLGAQAAADRLVCLRYPDRVQEPGQLLWGAVILEVAQCKNGKTRIEAHHVRFTEPCSRWPDQIPTAVLDSFDIAWTGKLAERCKGTSTLEYLVPEEPFVDQAAYEAWRDATLEQVRQRPAQQVEVLARGNAALP